jgi:hypothetical protein
MGKVNPESALSTMVDLVPALPEAENALRAERKKIEGSSVPHFFNIAEL